MVDLDELRQCARIADFDRDARVIAAAADEIERLRQARHKAECHLVAADANVERLRAALQRIVTLSEHDDRWHGPALIARAALAGASEPLPGGRPLSEYVAEVEAQPGMKERLDAARRRVRDEIAEPASTGAGETKRCRCGHMMDEHVSATGFCATAGCACDGFATHAEPASVALRDAFREGYNYGRDDGDCVGMGLAADGAEAAWDDYTSRHNSRPGDVQ